MWARLLKDKKKYCEKVFFLVSLLYSFNTWDIQMNSNSFCIALGVDFYKLNGCNLIKI